MALVSMPVNVQPRRPGGWSGPGLTARQAQHDKIVILAGGASYTIDPGGYELVTAANGRASNTQLTSATIDSKVAPT
jgi:hypothetical protein